MANAFDARIDINPIDMGGGASGVHQDLDVVVLVVDQLLETP